MSHHVHLLSRKFPWQRRSTLVPSPAHQWHDSLCRRDSGLWAYTNTHTYTENPEPHPPPPCQLPHLVRARETDPSLALLGIKTGSIHPLRLSLKSRIHAHLINQLLAQCAWGQPARARPSLLSADPTNRPPFSRASSLPRPELDPRSLDHQHTCQPVTLLLQLDQASDASLPKTAYARCNTLSR